MKVVDITGQQFGDLTALHRGENNKHGQGQWVCSCACGTKEFVALGQSLRNGKIKHCGCKTNKTELKDMMGLIIGRLTVIGRESNSITNKTRWRCKCSCGKETIVIGQALRRGLRGEKNGTQSCGCLRGELLTARNLTDHPRKTHGRSNTIEYILWNGAKKRARDFGLPFEITLDDIVIPEVCPILGIKLTKRLLGKNHILSSTPSLDRVIPELGYVPGNIRVVSFRANRIKSDATSAELSALANYMKENS